MKQHEGSGFDFLSAFLLIYVSVPGPLFWYMNQMEIMRVCVSDTDLCGAHDVSQQETRHAPADLSNSINLPHIGWLQVPETGGFIEIHNKSFQTELENCL